MATIAETVGAGIAAVALLHALLQIISYLSGENIHVKLWTGIRDMVDNLSGSAPAPVSNHVTNQVVNYIFNKPCHITFTPGNGQAPEINQIQGYRPRQIEYQADSD